MANEKRLIDANALDEAIRTDFWEHFTQCHDTDQTALIDMVCEDIGNAPTVDAVEVVHGRWEWYTDRCEDLFLGCDDDYGWRCSKCKVPLDDEDDPEVMPTFRYCPNCGAKMDGDGDGDGDD